MKLALALFTCAVWSLLCSSAVDVPPHKQQDNGMSSLLRYRISLPQTFSHILVSMGVLCSKMSQATGFPLSFSQCCTVGHYRNGSQVLPENQTLIVINGTGICLKTGKPSGLKLSMLFWIERDLGHSFSLTWWEEPCCCVKSEAGS